MSTLRRDSLHIRYQAIAVTSLALFAVLMQLLSLNFCCSWLFNVS